MDVTDALRALEYVSMRMYIGVPRPLSRCEAHLLFVVTLPTLSRLRCTAASMCSVRRGTVVYQLLRDCATECSRVDNNFRERTD